jgi:hypothetical protein
MKTGAVIQQNKKYFRGNEQYMCPEDGTIGELVRTIGYMQAAATLKMIRAARKARSSDSSSRRRSSGSRTSNSWR